MYAQHVESSRVGWEAGAATVYGTERRVLTHAGYRNEEVPQAVMQVYRFDDGGSTPPFPHPPVQRLRSVRSIL